MASMAKRISTKSNYKGALTLEVLEGAHRYNKWIADIITPFIDSPVLEIGSGIGNISSLFVNKFKITLSDNDKSFTKYLKTKFDGVADVSEFDIEKNVPQALEKKFSSVVGINVLEHIEDDRKALLNIKKTLKKGGRLILLVPAKRIAYSRLDKQLGHFRRYEKDEIKQKLENAGYEVNSISYFNSIGLLSWMVGKYLPRQNVELTKRQMALFDLVVPLIKNVEKIIPVPVGISLIAVATDEKN